MEPFKINIEISLSERSIAAITTLLDKSRAVVPAGAPAEAVIPSIRPVAAPPRPEPAKAPETPEAAEPAADLPVADEELLAATRDAVARVKAAGGSPSIIREQVFAKYGISASTQCPEEKRAALLKDLNAINA